MVCAVIVQCLDEVVTRQMSLTVWDMFAFPEAKEEHWQVDCLSYYPGKVVNVGMRMLGLWLVIQDVAGWYSSCMHMLLYEGQMLAYNPATNFMEWVPMQDVLASLTSTEL